LKFGIIGGTGFYEPGLLENEREFKVKTPYGNTSLKVGRYRGKEVAFLPRHGEHHLTPPHLINYRANIWALREIGVTKVIATAAVGSLQEDLKPGEIVLVDQFLDFTKNRPQTFYEGGEAGVLHVDMTSPYCPSLHEEIYQVARQMQVRVHRSGTYVCTEGPRYETPAEIRMFRILGGDVVGMTSVPEVVLAREATLCYATLALITNYAAGISLRPLSHQEVVEAMDKARSLVRELIFTVIEHTKEARPCACPQAAQESGSLGKKEKEEERR
jgi:5'-methylthioadenosine phosphorylase